MKSITKVARDDATPGRKLIHIEGRSDAIPADLVIIGAGVRPATDFLRCPESGVELLQDGSVGVDQYFAIKGATDAYAIGDIATFPYWGPGSGLFGGRTTTRIEHWNVAQNAGRAVGEYIAHSALSPLAKDPPPKEFVPIFWSALSGQLRYAGNTINGFDDVVVVNERTEPHVKFVAYYTVADTVVAVASMNSDPVVMKCAVLMRARRMLTKTEIQQGVSPLSVKV
ncbi:hypothetical protein KEM52_005762 [Ascosphaera acerosa]|nr:hypothetical protein KEM52_005762 [Ascosphaera acerosa]